MSVHGGTQLIVTDIKQNLIATPIHYITQPVICHIIFKNYIFKLVAGLGGITEGFAKCPDSPKSINYLKLGKTNSVNLWQNGTSISQGLSLFRPSLFQM